MIQNHQDQRTGASATGIVTHTRSVSAVETSSGVGHGQLDAKPTVAWFSCFGAVDIDVGQVYDVGVNLTFDGQQRLSVGPLLPRRGLPPTTCSCQPIGNEFNVCKHLVAVLLTVSSMTTDDARHQEALGAVDAESVGRLGS